jgi:hypothetical protein
MSFSQNKDAEQPAMMAASRGPNKLGGGTLRSTAAGLAATLSLPASTFTIHASANLDVTSRQRGPQAHHIRAGVRSKQAIDLTSCLEEAPSAVVEVDVGAQTDTMLRPPSPKPYRAAKRGVDAVTQVEHGSAEWQVPGAAGPGTSTLFSFDLAVSSLVDSLASAVLGQAQVEAGHEGALLDAAGRREEATRMLALDEARERELEGAVAAAAATSRSRLEAARAGHGEVVAVREKIAAAAASARLASESLDAGVRSVRAAGGFVDEYVQGAREVLASVLQGVAANAEASAGPATAVVAELVQGALVKHGEAYEARLVEEAAAAALAAVVGLAEEADSAASADRGEKEPAEGEAPTEEAAE